MSVNLINLFQHELYNDPEWILDKWFTYNAGDMKDLLVEMNVPGDEDDIQQLVQEIDRVYTVNTWIDLIDKKAPRQQDWDDLVNAMVLTITKEAAFEEGELYHNRLIDAGSNLKDLIDKVTKQLILERGDLAI